MRRTRRRGRTVARAAERAQAEDADADVELLMNAVRVGLATGCGVVALNKAVFYLQELIAQAGGFRVDPLQASFPWGPLVGAAVVTGVSLLQGQLDGTNLPSLRAVAARQDSLEDAAATESRALGVFERARRAFFRFLLAAATLGSGNSLGPEGPSVEVGGNVAAFLGGFGEEKKSLMRSAEQRLSLLASGCAAGVAAGFNAPIAGLFFAVEVVRPPQSEQVAVASVVSRLLAAAIAASVSQTFLGSAPAIQGIDFTRPVMPNRFLELPFFVLLGLLSGAIAAGFGLLRKKVAPIFTELTTVGVPRVLHPLIGSMALVLVAGLATLPQLNYQGFGAVNEIIRDAAEAPPGRLVELLVGKMVLTVVAIGSGLVGGLFAPALFMGAAGGALFAQGLGAAIGSVGFLASSTATDFAAVGAASCLGAICGVPCTAVVLLLELDAGSDYAAIGLPVILSVGVSVYAERFLSRTGEDISLRDVSREAIVRVSGFSPEEDAKVEAMFQSLDRNNDGSVCREEFREWMISLPEGRVAEILSGVESPGLARPSERKQVQPKDGPP